MSDSTKPPEQSLNSYRRARRISPGCQHNLGCRCDPPYWLRPSTPEEEAIEERLYGSSVNLLKGPE